MEIGPVQLMIIGFDRIDQFKGEIARELKVVTAFKQMRILDLLFVAKDENGAVTSRSHTDLTVAEGKELGKIIGPLLGLDGDQASLPERPYHETEAEYGLSLADAREVAAMIEPGTAGLILLFEHVWAAELSAAIRRAGGRLLSQGMLTRELIMVAGEELTMIAEAEQAIEAAEAVKGMAILEAMTTVALAEEVKEQAIEDAAETVAAAELVKMAVVAETVQALIVAGMIKEAAAQEAIEALVAADLLGAALVEEAAAQADSVNGSGL